MNIYKNPLEKDSYLILCEELNIKEECHDTNIRAWLRNLLEDNEIKDKNIWTEELPPKHIYVYYLDKRMKRKINASS